MVSSAIRHHLPALESGAERLRLAEAHEHMKPWYRWGPYLSERQWGTVREDYSPYGSAWDSFSQRTGKEAPCFQAGEELPAAAAVETQ